MVKSLGVRAMLQQECHRFSVAELQGQMQGGVSLKASVDREPPLKQQACQQGRGRTVVGQLGGGQEVGKTASVGPLRTVPEQGTGACGLPVSQGIDQRSFAVAISLLHGGTQFKQQFDGPLPAGGGCDGEQAQRGVAARTVKVLITQRSDEDVAPVFLQNKLQQWV